MKPRRCDAGRRAFTLIELLIVVAIIGLLLAIFLPTFRMVHARLLRLRCQTNLVNCHKVMMQYAANNRTYLPPFSGSNPMEVIDEYGSELPHQCAEELKLYGARAEVFTCPAFPGYQDPADYKWNSWKKPRFTQYSSSTVKQVFTGGYVFFNGFWSGLPQNNYRRWHDYFKDGRKMPAMSDAPGNPPLGADMLGYWVWGQRFIGWYHDPNALQDQFSYPRDGGGSTIFLSGAVCWFDWEELEADEDYQPMYPGLVSWNVNKYYCGRAPKGN